MSDNEKLQEQKEKIIKTLATMFDYLGLNATLRIEEKGNRLAVKITSDDAGRIIGRKGQALESLQLLLNRIMFKDNEDCPHILLDIDGYAKGEREARAPRENEKRTGNSSRAVSRGNAVSVAATTTGANAIRRPSWNSRRWMRPKR